MKFSRKKFEVKVINPPLEFIISSSAQLVLEILAKKLENLEEICTLNTLKSYMLGRNIITVKHFSGKSNPRFLSDMSLFSRKNAASKSCGLTCAMKCNKFKENRRSHFEKNLKQI